MTIPKLKNWHYLAIVAAALLIAYIVLRGCNCAKSGGESVNTKVGNFVSPNSAEIDAEFKRKQDEG